MTIAEYCDTINADIIVTRYYNQNETWLAWFDHCEVKNEGILYGRSSGYGKTPQDAINSYFKQIMGKVIVLNAMSPERRELIVPNNIILYS